MFQPVSGNAGYRWHLVRMKAGSVAEVTLLSRSFFALGTHFLGVTIPCPGEKCDLCEILPVRGLFYLAAECEGMRSIVELGAVSANDLEQHLKLLHGGLRPGVVVELSRRTAKAPIRSEFVRCVEGAKEVDRLILCQRVMAVYKFPPCNPTDSIGEYEQRIRQMAIRRNTLHAQALLKRQNTGVGSR